MSRLIEALDARINPVWVKEVRQALRGKLFRIGYLATLLIAGMASLIAVAEPRERMGVGVFDVGFVALCVAIIGLVPFTAFYATPSDREAHSLDLVLISGLKPGQIARGRLLGAMTQAGLFLCAFLPFLSLSAVLPGVDLLAALVSLGSVVLYSAGASAASIALGLITRNRLLRALAGLWLSGMLMYLVMGAAVAGRRASTRTRCRWSCACCCCRRWSCSSTGSARRARRWRTRRRTAARRFGWRRWPSRSSAAR